MRFAQSWTQTASKAYQKTNQNPKRRDLTFCKSELNNIVLKKQKLFENRCA